jgi:hypothetical protein
MKAIKQIPRVSLVLLLVIAPSILGLSQGPWVKEKGHGYSHLVFGVLPTYNGVFNGNFNKLEDLGIDLFEVSLQSYTEYGFAEKWQLTTNVPFQLINIRASSIQGPASNHHIVGFGNVEIGAKYELNKGKIPVAIGVNVGLPTGSSEDHTGLRTAYQSTYVYPYLSTGKGFDRTYVYGFIGAGLFTQDISNDLRMGGEIGRHYRDKIWVMINFSLKQSLFDRETPELDTYLATRLYVNNQWYNSFALKLAYEISDNKGLNFSTNLISTHADNLPFQRPFSLGYYIKW